MRIYTKRGDEGQTDLFGGARLMKYELRIAAYGEVDELNAALGWCASAYGAAVTQSTAGGGEEMVARLRREQARLFDLGAHLATAPDAGEQARGMLPAWPTDACAVLESEIDAWDATLPALKTFILPGGVEAASRLHVARTVCRRVERLVAELANVERVEPAQLAYLNRLSDWLFTAARAANAAVGEEDIPWSP